MRTLSFERPESFDLGAAADFYRGFVPGSGMAASTAASSALTLSFHADHSFAPVAVRMRQTEKRLLADVFGDADDVTVRAQVGRILGLEGDPSAWAALGRREPVVGKLQREFPGFFTAAKASPWDAATWSIIVQRVNMNQAARVKKEMARVLGDAVDVDGEVHHVFPAPATVLGLEKFPGLSDEKVARLRGVAQAACDGKLDADRLRALGEDAALAELQELRGIGPWAASHVYFRGAAPIDALPIAEPRVLHAVADVYECPVPSIERFQEIAESWRPFRMWVCVLLSRHLARTDGWRAPGLARARASAGRRIARRVAATCT